MQTWSVSKPAVAEHQGTASSTYLIEKEQFQALTGGTYLGLVSVFEVHPGARLKAHQHPTHEYWFVLDGEGVMQVAQEARVIRVGDLIYTPPNTPHTVLNNGDSLFRAFCFAQSYDGQGSQHTDVDLPLVEPS
jgi:quercetin dioxygenase-like cupin family protein